MRQIIDDLSNDDDLKTNVESSSQNAFESAFIERYSSKINDGILGGMMSGDMDKAQFYTEFSEDESAKVQVCNKIIRNIKDLLALVD